MGEDTAGDVRTGVTDLTELDVAASAARLVPAPPRRTVGVVRRTPAASPTSRLSAAPRYPAMFHVAGGRLVWDGSVLRLVRGDGTVVEPTGRPVVTITGEGRDVVVTWPADHTGPVLATGARATRVVLLDGSAQRFARFARNLAAARPVAVVLDDRTVPSARVPRLAPERAGTARRPGVFTRALWRVVGRSAAPVDDAAPGRGGGLVDQLERLATLHRAGELTDAEHTRAKERLLG